MFKLRNFAGIVYLQRPECSASGSTVNGNMTIPAGATCTVTDVSITGNVQGQSPSAINTSCTVGHDFTSQGGGNIFLVANTFDHDLTVSGANSICMGGLSGTEGNVVSHDETIQRTTGSIAGGSPCAIDGFQPGQNVLCNTTIGHDFGLSSNVGPFKVGDLTGGCTFFLTIDHDGQINHNGTVTFENNTVEHDLSCNGNTSVTTSGNTVGHNESGQCTD
jgi:hypothetical protein